MHGERILFRDFTPGFRTRLQYKDLNVALETGPRLRRTAARDRARATALRHAHERGYADVNHSVLVTVLEELAGTTVA